MEACRHWIHGHPVVNAPYATGPARAVMCYGYSKMRSAPVVGHVTRLSHLSRLTGRVEALRLIT